MKQLWAPWRKAYIRPRKNSRRNGGCLFCRLLRDKKDRRNFILKRVRHAYAILNLYPYNNGHVMIVPNRHVAWTRQLSDPEKLDWLRLTEAVMAALERSLRPQGFNLGINHGKSAGAGIPQHLHLHLVPRWQGDSNFMPILGQTKVISESLASVYQLLVPRIDRFYSKARRDP